MLVNIRIREYIYIYILMMDEQDLRQTVVTLNDSNGKLKLSYARLVDR